MTKTSTRRSNTIVTDLYNATRLNNSVNGNPRWTLHTSDGDYTLSSDAGCGYAVTNMLPKRGALSTRVELTLTRAGRVAYMTDISQDDDERHPDDF